MKRKPTGPVFVEQADGTVSGVLDDLLSQGQQVLQQTQVSELVDSLVRSSQFGKVLDEVESSARKAVVEETSKNAMNLFLLAMAGGAIGGALFRGTTGIVAAGLLAAFAASKLSGSEKPEVRDVTPKPTR